MRAFACWTKTSSNCSTEWMSSHPTTVTSTTTADKHIIRGSPRRAWLEMDTNYENDTACSNIWPSATDRKGSGVRQPLLGLLWRGAAIRRGACKPSSANSPKIHPKQKPLKNDCNHPPSAHLAMRKRHWNEKPRPLSNTNQNASEDPVKATMSGSEVLKTGCRREKAGQCGYWKGMTGYCTTAWKCMETISFTLSMRSAPIRLVKRDCYLNEWV